jgi:dTDP-4-dehydrorhamnose reductase
MKDELDIRPLVVGADGLVGRALTAHLEHCFPHTISATRTELDITDRWRMEAEVERLEPTVVINCAAMASVDACERDPDAARRVNADGPASLAAVCRRARLRLVHLSTDYVFGGSPPRDDEFDESDPPDPINEYGRSKLLGELGVLETLVEAVVLRVSFVFGPGRETFIDRLAAAARAPGATLPVVDGWRTRPTPVEEICRGIEDILRSDVTGVWHLASPPAVTRLGFGREVFRLAGADPERIVATDAAALQLPAPRPQATPLSTRRFEARFGRAPRSWIDAAREYLEARGGGA